MKLSNRFPDEVRYIWQEDWNACIRCGRNRWDAIHHIISPPCQNYVKGKHNRSIYNSMPIHNFSPPGKSGESNYCHIGQESFLAREKNIKKFLNKVYKALEFINYQKKPIDKKFLKIYSQYYEN